MNPESSPFTPGQPAPPDLFTGREKEVNALLAMVRMAKTKGLQVGWISGERGMGKSSLASFVAHLAERDQKAVVAHVHLGGIKDLDELAKETHLQLLKDNQNKKWGQALWDKFGKHIKSVGVFGVQLELEKTADILPSRAGDFPDALGYIVKTAGDDREVLLLTFDDINGLADNPKFAHWVKSMSDSQTTSGKNNSVCLLFVGTEDRLQQIKKENVSVARIFRPLMNINPWSWQESEEFFKNSFEKHRVQIEQADVGALARFSGGLPTVAHELGHAVWEEAKDGRVTPDNVFAGAVVAAGRVGARYLESDVIQALQGEKYLSILWKVARLWEQVGPNVIDFFTVEFSRKQLLPLLDSAEKKNMDNFLKRMRDLGAIVPVKDGRRGVYRFPTHLHKIYFFMESRTSANGKDAKKT
ncbi:MAG: ATP-binding protein [Gammaproteobacteria bacterium]|nr:ATP-binding protein [Gammaproteobacteria bacterium]